MQVKTLSLSRRYGFKITIIYLLISACWIIFSDHLLVNITESSSLLAQMQIYKGLFFVIATSVLLYFLISKNISSIEKARNQMEKILDKNQILLSELHHRVKNNLAIIAGLIELQADGLEEPAAMAFRETQYRIYTLADIEEMVYQGEDMGNIPFHKLLEQMVSGLKNLESGNFVVQAKISELYLNINQAVPFGLLANEIFSQFRTNGVADKIGLINVGLYQYLPHRVVLEMKFEKVPDQIKTRLMTRSNIEATLIELYTKQLKASSIWKPINLGGSYRIEFEKSDRKGSSSMLAGNA